MINDPRNLKKVLLEEASTDQQKEFAKMLAEQCAEAELKTKGHRCHCFIPNRIEYERMAKYADNDTCPKCGKGRIVLEHFDSGIAGDNYWLKCYWGKPKCDFAECVNDDER